MSKNKIKLPKMNTRAGFQPDTFNEEDRTIEVVFSVGAKGKRYSYNIGEYLEELSMKKSDVRLERLNSGAPVLNNHQRYKGLEGILGVVEKAFIRNKEGIAIIRFSERDEVQGIIKDIRSGVIRNVSVGYTIHKLEDVSKKNDEIPTLRATDWEPMEISFVDIPFDVDSQTRSHSQDSNQEYDCIIERNEEQQMNKELQIREACKGKELSDAAIEKLIARAVADEFKMENLEQEIKTVEEAERSAAPTPTPEPIPEPETNTVNEEEVRAAAIKEERERTVSIETAARALGVSDEDTKSHITKGTSADEFRKLMISAKAEADAKNPTNNHNVEGNSVDTNELRKKGAEQALLNRHNSAKFELSDEGKEFRHATLIDLARNFLEAEGVSTMGMSSNAVAERAMHSSSDFKNILANVANKSLRAAYKEGPQTFGFMTRSVVVNDFKEISRTQFGDAPMLEKVNEHGEFKHGTISDSAEKYSLQTYGKIVAVTRKTIVNDDLGAFTRIPEMFGRRARDLESELIWNIIGSNPLMADGKTLFHADHGNLGLDAGVFNVDRVGAAREAMRLQTGLDGLLIDILPKHMVVPVALETKAEQFLGATVPQLDDNVNPFKNKLSPVSEPRLDKYSKQAWYMMASTDQLDMIEIARLAGEEGPMISSRDGFEVDGMQIKIRYDFAAKVLDHRGFFKNAGA